MGDHLGMMDGREHRGEKERDCKDQHRQWDAAVQDDPDPCHRQRGRRRKDRPEPESGCTGRQGWNSVGGLEYEGCRCRKTGGDFPGYDPLHV